MRNSIEYRLWGRTAMFCDPTLNKDDEKYSYTIPTYQALKGITESIYWKPSITWYIDKIRIVNKINTQNVGVKTKDYNSSMENISDYSYLKDVEYHICAHFEYNLNRPDLKSDWDENKHHNIAKRVLKKGGRRDIFLGTRECQGYVEPFDFNDGISFYEDRDEVLFGTMVHGINYPNDCSKKYGVRLWEPVMKNGVIVFPRPEQVTNISEARDYSKQKIKKDSIQGVDDLYCEIFCER